jgi:hypothetical protein
VSALYRVICLSVLSLGLGVATGSAQSQDATTTDQSPYNIRNEVFAGGNYFRAANGPSLARTNFGGWNISATRYFTPLLGFTADFQGDYGHAPVSSGLGLSSNPFVYQHAFVLGSQIRWRRKEHFASSFRVLVGAVDAVLDSDTRGSSPTTFGLYPNATKLAMKFGGTFDISLSPRVALRVAPGTLIERFNGAFQRDFGISTGFVFRLGKHSE